MCPQCLGFVAPVPSLQPEPDEQTPSSKCTGYTSSLADSSFLNLTRTKIEALLTNGNAESNVECLREGKLSCSTQYALSVR